MRTRERERSVSGEVKKRRKARQQQSRHDGREGRACEWEVGGDTDLVGGVPVVRAGAVVHRAGDRHEAGCCLDRRPLVEERDARLLRPADDAREADGRGGDDTAELDSEEGVVLVERGHRAPVVAPCTPRPRRDPQLLAQLLEGGRRPAERVRRAALGGRDAAVDGDELRGVLEQVAVLEPAVIPVVVHAPRQLQRSRCVEREAPLLQPHERRRVWLCLERQVW
jgi:hypothetical protein